MANLFANTVEAAYRPRPTADFLPRRIVLAKGSRTTPDRRRFADATCAAYPDAEVLHQPDVPHNRVDLGEAEPLRALRRGKQTLVLGEHRSAVRESREDGNTCPNYWHFSPYGFCPYGCHYCYLAGTPGVRFSPTVKVFVNLGDALARIDRVATRLAGPTAFYVGKLQDGLALDPLTGYVRTLVPFFATHRHARMTLLTKSAAVDNLLDLDHRGHTILSWSLNPAEVVRAFEPHTPPLDDRLAAMKRCAGAGYPVRAVIMPIIPVHGWEAAYGSFLRRLLADVPLERITLGGICSYPTARGLLERRLGRDNAISRALDPRGPSADGRLRYPPALRTELYGRLIRTIRECEPRLDVGLCLEEAGVFRALDLTDAIGRCNCVL